MMADAENTTALNKSAYILITKLTNNYSKIFLIPILFFFNILIIIFIRLKLLSLITNALINIKIEFNNFKI